MKRTLLYGPRQQKAIERSEVFSYRDLFTALADKSLALPDPYRLEEVNIYKRADLQEPSVEFSVLSPAGPINGTLLVDNHLPTVALDYCPWEVDNEKGLFTFLAGKLSEPEMLAYLNVPIASQRLSLDKVALQDFATRYRLGWRLRSSYYFDRRSEEECMRELARSRSIDQASRRLIASSASLEALLARPGGQRALALFSANHFLYLKRPLADLRLR